MKWLQSLTTFLFVLPGLVHSVTQTVEAFEVPGNGAHKRQAVINTIATAYDAANLVEPKTQKLPKETLLNLAGSVTDVVVGFKNIVGVFDKEGQKR